MPAWKLVLLNYGINYGTLCIYTVSQKRDPDIIDCNFGKD